MSVRAILPLALAAFAPVSLLAAAAHTVDELVRTVSDALQGRQSDSELARRLHRIDLREKLDNRTAEELESQAPGPQSISEIERLRELSSGQLPPQVLPQFASPPEPALDEQRKVLEEARAKALAYTAGLPDFVCTETIRRYQVYDGYGWDLHDTLTVQLSYFERQENYKLTALNGRKTDLTYEKLGGAWSKGEFGSMLLAVFVPTSLTGFRWSNWTTLRKRPAYVFYYQIDAGNSKYSLTAGKAGGGVASATVGEHGLVYIDRETKDVMRLDREADSIPNDFPVKSAGGTLDYGAAEVGGRTYLLPLRAVIRMLPWDGRHATRNEVEFTGYRKFIGESTISFGDPSDAKPAPVPGAIKK